MVEKTPFMHMALGGGIVYILMKFSQKECAACPPSEACVRNVFVLPKRADVATAGKPSFFLLNVPADGNAPKKDDAPVGTVELDDKGVITKVTLADGQTSNAKPGDKALIWLYDPNNFWRLAEKGKDF